MSKNIIAQKSKDLIKFTLKHYSFKDKLVLVIYVLMSFIGKCIFFIKPVFDVADDNLARMIVETHYLNFPMVFKGIKKRYGELLLVDTIRSLESLAIALVLFGLPFLVLSLTPNPLTEQTPGHYIAYGLAVLTLIVSYLIGVKYWAVPHIILANSNLTGSDGMLMSKLSKKQYGGIVLLVSSLSILFVFSYEISSSIIVSNLSKDFNSLFSKLVVFNKYESFSLLLFLIIVANLLLKIIAKEPSTSELYAFTSPKLFIKVANSYTLSPILSLVLPSLTTSK